ncbi:unnamed protein product [Blepharisma stoltei]|uniref:Uncharacterized protein n=1 Tax=Blepharisma stoltei TaxID=1481888 RepID=A0AAU9JI59_9CILI|nr:unnamed protein product [Blepharisma stoltei]
MQDTRETLSAHASEVAFFSQMARYFRWSIGHLNHSLSIIRVKRDLTSNSYLKQAWISLPLDWQIYFFMDL